MNNVLIERKNHVFRHSMIERDGGRLSYEINETAINEIGQYIGQKFCSKKNFRQLNIVRLH